jgi:ZIP family zinc transporter
LELQLLVLGIIAGFTIFLGIPIVRVVGDNERNKGFLSAVAAGILLFILVEILSDGAEPVAEAATKPYLVVYTTLYIVGFSVGVLSLVAYESRYLHRSKDGTTEYSVATLTAYGIGLHNFGEGLAIGAAFASGALGLATLLVVGFGAHNSTEGFAVFSPLRKTQMAGPRLVGLGLLGGGPTLVGTLVGGFFSEPLFTTFLYSLAGGSVLYVLTTVFMGTLAKNGRKVGFLGLVAGFTLGFITDTLIVFASGGAL